MLFPAISTSGFPGKRVEANRAGMIPKIFIVETVSNQMAKLSKDQAILILKIGHNEFSGIEVVNATDRAFEVMIIFSKQ